MSRILNDGFSTTLLLENIPDVPLFEKEVTPIGYSAGGPIETTTMRNSEWRTNAPRQLKTALPFNATVAFGFAAIPSIEGQIGINQRITVTFPDGSTVLFWGWVESFIPSLFKEGEQSVAQLVIQPSCQNNNGQETGPTYIDIALAWILASGSWNDEGIWIDTSVWEDGP